MHKKSLLLLIT